MPEPRAVNEAFRVLYESSRDAIMTLAPGDGFLSGNPAALALFGCPDEAAFTKLTPAKLSPERQPDGRSSEEKAKEIIALAMEKGSHLFEWVHVRTDGSPFWAEVLLTRVDMDGKSFLQASVRNIEDRKRAEAEIRALNAELKRQAAETTAESIEASNRLRLLIDSASDAVVTIDAEGAVIDWNPAAHAIFGWSREEAIGQPLHALIVPERMREAHRTGLRRFLASGEGTITHRTIEIKALHRNGHEFDVELAIWPVKSGDSYTFSAFLRDISERKRIEGMLEQRTNKIRIQRDVLVRLASLDKSDFNRALGEILRESAATLRVERASFWVLSDDRREIVCRLMFLHSEDAFAAGAGELRLTADDFPEYFEAIGSRQSLAVDDAREHPATRAFTPGYLEPNGIGALLDATVWIHGKPLGVVCHEHVGGSRTWTAEEVDFTSSIATMISLALESSERVQAEKRLLALQQNLRDTLAEREAVLENSGVGIALVRDGAFVWANRTLSVMSGFSLEELAGRAPSFLYVRNAEDPWFSSAAGQLQTGEPVRIERPLLNASEEPVWTRLSACSLDPERPGAGSIWTVEDISERVRAEEEIRRALEKTKELGELKTRFVAMTSHEFRTPLSTILSSAELLEHYGGKMPAEEKAVLWESIVVAVRRMTEMLDDVLVIGRADSEEFDLQLARVDLKSLCDGIVAEFRRSLPEGLSIDYSEPPPGNFILDEKLLRHALVNLMSNAIKYSPQGGTIVFSAGWDAGAVTFEVSDCGIGIPEKDLPRLFESFHRAGNVGNISGTGLGLAIVKKSVERHGGTINVRSEEGRGTTFTINIPHGATHGEDSGD